MLDCRRIFVSFIIAVLLPGCASTTGGALPRGTVALDSHSAISDRRDKVTLYDDTFGDAVPGDDGAIWGGEVFRGSLARGLHRTAHLRRAFLPGGDAAARFPVQAAAGFLYDVDAGVSFVDPPFSFPERYTQARELVKRGVRAFETTSMGRLFDTVAALVGFTHEQSFEGQAAMWLEHLARSSREVEPYPFPFEKGEFDFRPTLREIVADRNSGRAPPEIARAFHGAVANAIVGVANDTKRDPVVVSGGVFQNALLVELLGARLHDRLWFNTRVPPNDGGLSLGQAAHAAMYLHRAAQGLGVPSPA